MSGCRTAGKEVRDCVGLGEVSGEWPEDFGKVLLKILGVFMEC